MEMFTFYAHMYANPLTIPSDWCTLNPLTRWVPDEVWRRAYLTDLVSLTGNPDGENW